MEDGRRERQARQQRNNSLIRERETPSITIRRNKSERISKLLVEQQKNVSLSLLHPLSPMINGRSRARK
jgi:hypothetical protein